MHVRYAPCHWIHIRDWTSSSPATTRRRTSSPTATTYYLGRSVYNMKVLHLYQVKMLDGSQYRGEIAYRDDEKIVLRLRHRSPEQKLRLLKNSIASVRDVGYQKAYALR